MNEPRSTSITSATGPVYHVVGLLNDKSEIPAISRELESAGVAPASVHWEPIGG